MGAIPLPGQVPTNNQLPPGFRLDNAATWQYDLAEKLRTGIINNFATLGTSGMPASWPYGPIDPQDVYSDGSISGSLWTRVQTYAASDAAAADPGVVTYNGRPKPAVTGGEFSTPLLTPSQQMAIREQDFKEASFAIEMAVKQAASIRTASSGSSGSSRSSSSTRSSSGGSYSSASAVDPMEMARLALQEKLGMGQLNLDTLKFEADKAYRDAQLAENQRQFNASFGLQQQQVADERAYRTLALQQERAGKIAQLSADPGDMVQREYFLRLGMEPEGTPVDAFTGQVTGAPTTLSEVLKKNAPKLRPYMGAALSGGPAPINPTEAPPSPEVANVVAAGAAATTGSVTSTGLLDDVLRTGAAALGLPAFARGTRYGWTNAQQFIAGDSQMQGEPNPEMVKLRVKNGRAQAKVIPLRERLAMGAWR